MKIRLFILSFFGSGWLLPRRRYGTANLGLPAVPQFADVEWNSGSPTNGGFTWNFTGDSNATCNVWATTNLANWPQRYYRLSTGQ